MATNNTNLLPIFEACATNATHRFTVSQAMVLRGELASLCTIIRELLTISLNKILYKKSSKSDSSSAGIKIRKATCWPMGTKRVILDSPKAKSEACPAGGYNTSPAAT